MVIEPAACLAWCVLLLTLPLNWLLSAAFAALFHELCHLLVLLGLGITPGKVRIGPLGIYMDIPELPYTWEFFCAAAGPAGSFLLLLLRRWFPFISVCALIQGLFNLIPVYPLDGGRMLRALAMLMFPQRAANWLCNAVAVLFLAALAGLACTLGYGKILVIPVLFLLLPRLVGKIPCKARHIRVQ